MPRADFDYTMLSTFLQCHRKYDFRINQGLVPKKAPSALNFGGGIHKALDIWHTERNVDKAVQAFHSEFKEDLEADDKRSNKLGEWIIRNYATNYASEPWTLEKSEIAFCLPLPTGNNLIGRIDKIVKWDGAYWIMDHKTTSGLGHSFFKMVEPNLQFTGYVWAARQMGYNCVGIILDAILVAKGLLESSTRARLTPLARYDSYRSPDALQEWERAVKNIQLDISLCEDRGEWYPNFDSCTYYGECPYRKICIEDAQVRHKVITSEYKVEHWDPRRKEDKNGGS